MIQHVEKWKSLPDFSYPKIRSSLSYELELLERKEPDYDNHQTFFGNLPSDGYICLCNRHEYIKILGPKEFFETVDKRRYTFILMPRSYINLLWKGFSYTFKENITRDSNLGAREYNHYVVINAPRKIVIRSGSEWHTVFVLEVEGEVNKFSTDPESLVTEYMEKLRSVAGIEPNPISISATGRDFLYGFHSATKDYDNIRREFALARRMYETDRRGLELFYNGCKRPVMATAITGDTEPQWNRDQRTAYLLALLHAPTMDLYQTVLDSTPTFVPEANHAAYLVEYVMPPNWPFAPNLFRAGDDTLGYGTYSPTGGPQVAVIGQKRAELWKMLGIPFKIHEARKVLPAGGISYPWYERCLLLLLITTNPEIKKKLPHINLKKVYYAPLGSLLHVREYRDENGNDKWLPMNIFNPILMLWIYEWTSISTWLDAVKHPAYAQTALRIDATSIQNYIGYRPPEEPFRHEKPYPTPMFFANPREKDKDTRGGPTPYRDAVRRAADKGEARVIIEKSVIGSIKMLIEGVISEEQVGKHVTIKTLLSLYEPPRIPVEKEIILPSDLIDDQIRWRDPDVGMCDGLEAQRLEVMPNEED